MAIRAEILVVERDSDLASRIRGYLGERDCAVEWVDDGEKAYNLLDTRHYDVLVSDLNAHRVDGIRLMRLARDRNPAICVIFVAEQPDIERATEAMREGAYDFQTKPLNFGKLDAVINRALSHQHLLLEQHALRRRLDEQFGLISIVGRSRQMVHIYDTVRQIAPTDACVLIEGESGTGKDLIAQALHNNSTRRDAPLVKLNCVSIPEELTESELFGHMRGAFQTATRNRAGRLELADKGTLFLDDVGALPLSVQKKLLTFLETSQFTRMGGDKPIAVDVRLIVANSRPLASNVDDGTFIMDLYRRISAVSLETPPLRARVEDIPLLTEHFIRRYNNQTGHRVEGITRNAMDVLLRYDWPGNVRELRNIIEGMAASAREGKPLGLQDVPDHIRRESTPDTSEIRIPAGSSMADVERHVIEETMKLCEYDKEKCAQTLGIGLRTLYRKLKEYETH